MGKASPCVLSPLSEVKSLNHVQRTKVGRRHTNMINVDHSANRTRIWLPGYYVGRIYKCCVQIFYVSRKRQSLLYIFCVSKE